MSQGLQWGLAGWDRSTSVLGPQKRGTDAAAYNTHLVSGVSRARSSKIKVTLGLVSCDALGENHFPGLFQPPVAPRSWARSPPRSTSPAAQHHPSASQTYASFTMSPLALSLLPPPLRPLLTTRDLLRSPGPSPISRP